MTEYMSCAETAKLIRRAIKAEFPNTKFSVRSKTYSGGASINVSWTDGPTYKQVDAITTGFQGAGFDGMTDLKYYVSHWLLPDGSVQLAKVPEYAGYEREDTPKPHPNAEPVSFGADYVFCNRHLSDGMIAATKAAYAKLLPRERFELTKTIPAPYRPDSFSLDDATLADFGTDAEQAFVCMARNIPA